METRVQYLRILRETEKHEDAPVEVVLYDHNEIMGSDFLNEN